MTDIYEIDIVQATESAQIRWFSEHAVIRDRLVGALRTAERRQRLLWHIDQVSADRPTA